MSRSNNLLTKVKIIAEAGVNHNGSVHIAKELIDAALDAGADYVKFQTYKTDKLVTAAAPCAEYQVRNTGSAENQWKLLKTLELPQEDFLQLKAHATDRGIKFLSTAADEESARFLVEDVGIEYVKIPSGEVTNLPFVEYLAQFKKPVILSTGMCDLEEVGKAVSVLRKYLLPEQITLMHCTTSYPCLYPDVNLRAMLTLKEAFGLEVGYSDHTLGIEVPVAAVALGARVIEKHLTLDQQMQGPDHKASMNSQEFKRLVQAIRNIELALGQKEKKPTPDEIKIRTVARKSLVCAHPMKLGTRIKREDLLAKRPGSGIAPTEIDKLIGSKLRCDKEVDDLIHWSDLEK